MDSKPEKRSLPIIKTFWKMSTSKHSEKEYKRRECSGEGETLRTIFLDDMNVERSKHESPETDLSSQKDSVPRRNRASGPLQRDSQSICIPLGGEKDFTNQIMQTGKPEVNKVHEILVWYQNVLYRSNRIADSKSDNKSDFLKKLFLLLNPSEQSPSNPTKYFLIFDEISQEFRPIHAKDELNNGVLLKLTYPKGSSKWLEGTSSLINLKSVNDSPKASINSFQRPDVLLTTNLTTIAAPQLRRRHNTALSPTISKQEASISKETKSPISASPIQPPVEATSNMHSHTHQTSVRLPPTSTLIPATMQVDKNGERHLILHYPDGQTYATTVANFQGQLQIVPAATTAAACVNDIRLLPVTSAAVNDSHSFRGLPAQQQSQRKVEIAHTHVIRNNAGQRVELVCTCPPELHNSLRHSHEVTSQQDDGTLRQTKQQTAYILPESHDLHTVGSKWVIMGPGGETVSRSSPPIKTVARLYSPTGSSETCQESDSTDTTSSSGHAAFPSIRSGIPPDVLLASVLNEQIRRPTKPPQTLEEAQHRIAYMENQMAHLTAWVQKSVQKVSLQKSKPEDVLDGSLSVLPSSPSEILTTINPNHNQLAKSPPANINGDSAFSAKYIQSSDSSSSSVDRSYKYAQNHGHENQCLGQGDVTGLPSSLSKQMQLVSVYRSVGELRCDLDILRKSHEANIYNLHSMSNNMMFEIRKMLRKSSLATASLSTALHLALDNQLYDYKTGCQEVETWLCDLEGCIEDLRLDALSRRCRVSVNEVETYALHLSRLSRRLASFKGQIPDLRAAFASISPLEQAKIKTDSEGLCNEHKRLDTALSTCKQLTCTLFTLKRLGSVQKNGVSMNIPLLRTIRDPRPEDKHLFLQQIKKIIPNHEARMLSLDIYEKTRERRKRMTSLRESMQFERAVEVSERQMHSILHQLITLSQAKHVSTESDSGLSEDIVGEQTIIPSCLTDLSITSQSQLVDDSEESGLETPSPSYCVEQVIPISGTTSPSSSSWVCPIHQAALQESGMTAYSLTDNQGIQSFDERGQNACCDFYKSCAQEIAKSSYQQQYRSSDSSVNSHRNQTSSGGRRARVVFSRTVLVGDGRETTRLNCPSDLDDNVESEIDERDHFDDLDSSGIHFEEGSGAGGRYQPWRRDQMHRGNKVVDIHPGLPRNQYIICDGRCGAPACAEGSCSARQRGNTGSVLKSTSSYSSSSSEKSAPPAPPPRLSSNASSEDHLPTTSDHSKTREDEPTSVHEMRGHHHCCRLSGNTENDSRSGSF